MSSSCFRPILLQKLANILDINVRHDQVLVFFPYPSNRPVTDPRDFRYLGNTELGTGMLNNCFIFILIALPTGIFPLGLGKRYALGLFPLPFGEFLSAGVGQDIEHHGIDRF